MLVSWKWLSRYLSLPMSHEELAQRLALSGLNHEGTETVDDDVVIDLEVTSNRGDCLGHLGVAREISVLYDLPVTVPEIEISESAESVETLLSVENQFADACPRYTARVIRGVKVGPSPEWLTQSLASVGIASVNNIVDVTNYVLMECGQPLHAFDYAKVDGGKIIVRPAKDGEKIEAIDHREYELDSSMCVIADASRASAVAGVMGGAGSEVSESTVDIILESAIFEPLPVRRAARKLKLQSPSSYRFERRVDPVGVDWASRRACALIVQLAGGEVASGVIDTAAGIPKRDSVVLRASQLERILGIKIPGDEVQSILTKLGCEVQGKSDGDAISYIPPSWRHDLTREADLIEEVARIHGYDQIPEDAPIPVAPSTKRPFDVAIERIRQVMTSAGVSEAMTPSVVKESLDQAMSPWTELESLRTQTAMLMGSRCLRRTLIPSLLEGRGHNWASSSISADLFEIAHIYLPGKKANDLPSEQYSLGIVMGAEYLAVKGVVETLCQRMGIAAAPVFTAVPRDGFAPGAAVEIRLGDEVLGYIGIVDKKVLKHWKLPGDVVAAELSLPVLLSHAVLVPQQQLVSAYPSIERDLNFIVAEKVRWSEMENVVRAAIGTELASVTYRETYRDAKKDGPDRKRILMTVELQRHDSTLSGEQADELVGKLISTAEKKLQAELLS